LATKRTKKRKPNSGSPITEMRVPPAPGQVAVAQARQTPKEESDRWWREVVESIVVAIILALLFRAFEAEAFVIPTGSMAPTLQGKHHDISCEKCGYQYRIGASSQTVSQSNCPMCQYTNLIRVDKANHGAFSGDRILVNKFLYQFKDPKRWDVIVFKFPGNAKQNYIKRLVGLPGETIRIWHGDLYARESDDENFEILRKSANKMKALLHCVHDTKYVPEEYVQAQWPQRWKNDAADKRWQTGADLQSFQLEPTEQTAWLRYQHEIPNPIYGGARGVDDWKFLEKGESPPGADSRHGQLITDHYAYNDRGGQRFLMDHPSAEAHWVGDLAMECYVTVRGNTGELSLDLVEGGRHLSCTIDVSNGQAVLSLSGGAEPFADIDSGAEAAELTAQTKVQGAGKYRLMFANVDDQLRLWVNGRLVQFESGGEPHEATFRSPSDLAPRWSPEDAGDLLPAGIGGRGLSLNVTRLRVLRDVYYIAARGQSRLSRYPDNGTLDFDLVSDGRTIRDVDIRRSLGDPSSWDISPYFSARHASEFQLGPDQFFVLGDNSPQSKDARLWHGQEPSHFYDKAINVNPYVTRDMLIGKAFFVYWPHPWRLGTKTLPIVPNVKRMGRIK